MSTLVSDQKPDSENFPPSRLVWIDPTRCTRWANIGARRLSGIIRDDDFDLNLPLISENLKIRCCLLHWRQGVSWEETRLFDHILQAIERDGVYDGCHTQEQVIERYRLIDLMFEQVKADGYLRTARELGRVNSPKNEHGGVVFHIDRNGEPVFAGSGHHRFSAALALGIRRMPAMLGAVHKDAAEVARELLRSSHPPRKPKTVDSRRQIIQHFHCKLLRFRRTILDLYRR